MLDVVAWPLYADTRDRFIALVRALDGSQVDAAVPITPAWTIRQVTAHVCGLNADLAAGLREGLGTDQRTALQVETRDGKTIEQVCHEWLDYGATVEAIFADNDFLGHRLHADLVIHLHDVQHALGIPIDTADQATVDAGQTYATHTVDRWLDQAGIDTTIEFMDGGRFVPSSHDSTNDDASPMDRITLRATAYDFLRSVSGRRSRRQVETLDWSADPGPLLDTFSPYGPLRSADAPV
jgi:hypothetical protein